MNLSICRDGVEIGEWSEVDVPILYSQGELLPTDVYWREGMTEWKELKTFIKPPPPSTRISEPYSPSSNTPLIRSNVEDRYSNAYLIARLIIGIGKAVKRIAVSIIIIAGAICLYLLNQGGYEANILVPIVILLGLFAAAQLYVLGIIIEAAAQILLAILDIAVHTSPFLDTDSKASAMKIADKSTSASTPSNPFSWF